MRYLLRKLHADLSNLSEHHFLDWRLALDMVDLLLGHPLNFDRWFQEAFTFSETFVDNFNKRYGDTAKLEFGTFEELPVLFERTRRKALICSHPLWHCEKENKFQENAREQVHADIQSNINVKFLDIREFKLKPHEQELYFFSEF